MRSSDTYDERPADDVERSGEFCDIIHVFGVYVPFVVLIEVSEISYMTVKNKSKHGLSEM